MENPTVGDFQRSVGAILSEWAQVEFSHAVLFTWVASGTLNNTSLLKAYWAVVSFEARQKMVDAALRDAFQSHKQYLATWNNLNERLRSKNKTRNKIVHGTIVNLINPGFPSISLIPYYHARMHEVVVDGKFYPGLSLPDLKTIEESFRELNSALHGFSQTYYAEQIQTRETTLPDGSKVLPIFYRPVSPTPPEQPKPAQ